LMATTRTIVRSVVAQGATAPGEVLSRANDLLFRDTPPNLFVTCLYAVLDPLKGRLHYANAGHVPPLRRRAADGLVDQLRARGMPLGLMPGSVYEEHHADLDPGETVLFYSDGLVEAHDSSRQMFTTERLTTLAGRGGPEGAALIERVLTELDRFTGPDWQQEDDLTLLTLERRPEVQSTWQARQPWTFAESRVALDPGSRPALLTSAAT
jgi:serine phosphatase RsbU (regulator of sigma subunit)